MGEYKVQEQGDMSGRGTGVWTIYQWNEKGEVVDCLIRNVDERTARTIAEKFNFHDKLVEAMRKAVKQIRLITPTTDEGGAICDIVLQDMWEFLTAALAEVEKEKQP